MNKRTTAMLLLLLALTGCAAPHERAQLPTPLPTLTPTPQAPTAQPQSSQSHTAPVGAVSYSPYVVPASLRENPNMSTSLYKLIVDAAAQRQEQVDLSTLQTTPEQVEMARRLLLDRGEFAHLEDVVLKEGGLEMTYTTEDVEEVKQSVTAFREKVENILTTVVRPAYTPLESAAALYQYLAQNIEYSYETLDDGVYGALVEGKAVAQGYAYALQYLLDQLGIPNDIAISEDEQNIWNIVTVDGTAFHCDATFEASLTQGQSLSYFGMDDERRKETGGLSGWSLLLGGQKLEAPVCTDTRFAPIAQAAYSGMDYEGDAVFFDTYQEEKGIFRLDLASGDVLRVLDVQPEGLIVMGGLVYYLNQEDRLLYTYDLESGENVQILPGVKLSKIVQKNEVLHYFNQNDPPDEEIIAP